MLVIAYAHGTSGITPRSAPSGVGSLWQHFLAPFPLALAGYAVVGTGYKGLGVSVSATGARIQHEWVNGPDQAEDVIWSVAAARSAFPELLGGLWVAMGHSQGGGAAWGVAEKMAQEPVEGYLGAVAASPVTTWLDDPPTLAPDLFGALSMAPGIAAHAPPGSFAPGDILTPNGTQALELLLTLQGTTDVAGQLIAVYGPALTRPGWKGNSAVQRYQALSRVGGRPIKGPLLVLQGDIDNIINYTVTADGTLATARASPQEAIDFWRLRNVTHNPSLTAGRPIWMEWLADRFAEKGVEPGLRSHETEPLRVSAQAEINWFLGPIRYSWQAQ